MNTKKTVLLLEDDLVYAQVLTLLLEEEGFLVSHSVSATEGLLLYRQNPPDLLITDILLEGTDGLELLLAVKKEFPDCRVIAMSGGINGDTSWLSPLASILSHFRFLQKPFAFKSLRRIVDEVLAEGLPPHATTVLLVDDDDSVRDVLARLLETAGIVVITAAGADEAMAILKDKAVDVVVTDVVMPGITGIDLVKLVHTKQPRLPVVAVTGELVRGISLLENAAKYGVAATLVKPFTTKEFVETVQRCALHH